MKKLLISAILAILLTVCVIAEQPKSDEDASCCQAGASEEGCGHAHQVDQILEQLYAKTSGIKSYEALVEYTTRQPLLESKSVRKGVLYYARFDERSKLRLNFKTLKQDDAEEDKYVEHYIFDGIWLTQLNYQTRTPTKYQVSESNKPVDAFEAANQTLPMVGFMEPNAIKKEFEVERVDQKDDKREDFVQLHLKVRPNSKYKDDYLTVDFWVDQQTGLPSRVMAVSTEEDIYELRFLKPKIDKGIDEKVFDFKIPEGFSEPEIVPLKKKDKAG